MSYKIEKGVPAPVPTLTTKYPWHDMGSGDSFQVKGHRGRNRAQIAGKEWLRRNRPGWEVKTRSEGGEMYRIWVMEK